MTPELAGLFVCLFTISWLLWELSSSGRITGGSGDPDPARQDQHGASGQSCWLWDQLPSPELCLSQTVCAREEGSSRQRKESGGGSR